MIFQMEEVAAQLGKSRRWLQDFLRDRPYGRMAGRKRLFTESDVATLIEELPCPSSSVRRAPANRRIGPSGGNTSGSALTKHGNPDGKLARKILAKVKDEIESGAFSKSGPPTFAAAALKYIEAGGEERFILNCKLLLDIYRTCGARQVI